ncbi:MAG: hypothetical protein HDR06_12240 [Lachnospiraceae bacterium]|nr:hypothetical protein [Lachnospiraceae bacterium]
MNRRQKKKQFKKVYGMNPIQYKKWLQGHQEEIYVAAEEYHEWVKTVIERVTAATVEAAKVLNNKINEWAECYRAAADVIAKYNLQEGEKQDGENGMDS